MTREKIIRMVLHLFKQYGIKSVSMNMIAEELNMSKKTIYEEFDHKDEIVRVSLAYEVSRAREVFARREREAENALDAIMRISTDLSHYVSSYCPGFFKDLVRFPEAQEILRTFKLDVERMYLRLFKRGADEGLFLPDAEYEVVAKVFFGQFEQLKPEYQPSMSQTFLRGISTEKGAELLEKMARELKTQTNQFNNKI